MRGRVRWREGGGEGGRGRGLVCREEWVSVIYIEV